MALSLLIFSNINLYAVSFTDNDTDTIFEEFDCIEESLEKNPNLSAFTLKKLQNKFGLYDGFDELFGERYTNLKEKIKTELKKLESIHTARALELSATEDEFISVHFSNIIVSLSNPGVFNHLAKETLNKLKFLSVNCNKNCKIALEEALNEKKEDLLKGKIPDNKIPLVYIEVKDIGVYNSGYHDTVSFRTKNNPELFNKKPLDLNLHKLQSYTNSHISVTIKYM